MTFKEATDRLLGLGIDLREIADALGLGHQTVRAMRAAEGTRAARTPPAPDVWRPMFARLARDRGRHLLVTASIFAREFVAPNGTLWLVWAQEDADLGGTFWLTFESADGRKHYSLGNPQTQREDAFSLDELHGLLFHAEACPPT